MLSRWRTVRRLVQGAHGRVTGLRTSGCPSEPSTKRGGAMHRTALRANVVFKEFLWSNLINLRETG